VRLLPLLVLTSMTAMSTPSQPSGKTSVIWIYDCSQSHYSSLAPPPLEQFGVRSRPIEPLVQAVADNAGQGTAIRVLSFGTGLRLSPAWVRTRTELGAAMDCGDTLNGPSPIWDAVYRAAEVLEERSGPRAILMVTDGRSSANVHGYQEALERSKQSGVRINIGLARTELWRTSRPPMTLNANRAGDPAERLKKLTEATGGRYAELSAWDLPAFFAEVAREWQK
jgi:hypothetical protein